VVIHVRKKVRSVEGWVAVPVVAKWWKAWERNCWFVRLMVDMFCGRRPIALGLAIARDDQTAVYLDCGLEVLLQTSPWLANGTEWLCFGAVLR
jgi:hypothetical protein